MTTTDNYAALPIAAALEKYFVNRTDVWGEYLPDGGSITAPGEHRRGKDRLGLNVLQNHVLGRAIIGAHSTSPDDRCKWIAFDVDAHTADADPEANWQTALDIISVIVKLDLAPILEDSNGAGGFHIWVLFREPVAADLAFRAARWMKSEAGADRVEAFPKQASVAKTAKGCGNYVRLPGKHHKRDHRSRFYNLDAEDWLDADASLRLLLNPPLNDPAILEDLRPQMPPEDTASTADAAKGGPLVEACWSYIQANCEKAIAGKQGHSKTLRAACECFRFALSDPQAREVMDRFNAEMTGGERWSGEELEHKLAAAKTKVQDAGEWGQRLVEAAKGNAPPTDSAPDVGPPWCTIFDTTIRDRYSKGFPPITTGFAVLDKALRGGFRPEMTYVLAGRTGSAKSTLALNIARRVAIAGHPVLVFKLEESTAEAVMRMHAAASQVPLEVLMDGGDRRREYRDNLIDGWDLLRDLPLRFSDVRALADMPRIIAEHARQGGSLVVVDQLSMVQTVGTDVGYSAATMVSNELRVTARKHGVPILIVSQVNRPASKNMKDRLSCHDLRDSGCIENDAAGVILIDTARRHSGPDYGNPLFTLEVLIGKSRYGPATGAEDDPLELFWWPRICRIEDAAAEVGT